jgi:hypothetical protein
MSIGRRRMTATAVVDDGSSSYIINAVTLRSGAMEDPAKGVL